MISVIMLTYNREALVGRAVESILAQTYRDFEFIIVDNGSTDRSGAVADKYAAQDRRIRVIHRKRGSIGAGRNTGLDAAKGAYITFIDDDDWVAPDFLEFLYSLAIENCANVAICGATDRTFDDKRVMTAEEALIELMWRKRYSTGFPTKLFQASLLQDLCFSENDRFDDVGLVYKIFARAKAVAYYGLPKYHVLRHNDNNSAWTTNHKLLTPEILDEYLRTYRARTEWLCEKFPARAATWQYFECSFMISMVEKISRLQIPGCGRQIAAMKSELQKHQKEFLECPEILEFEKIWIKQYCL